MKFILNIDNEHVQDYSYPGATFAFCSHGEKLPRQGGLLYVVQQVTHLTKWAKLTTLYNVCSVHRGMFSASIGGVQYIGGGGGGGYHE